MSTDDIVIEALAKSDFDCVLCIASSGIGRSSVGFKEFVEMKEGSRLIVRGWPLAMRLGRCP